MEEAPPTILRGNASEILAVGAGGGRTKGVDSTIGSEAAVEHARELAGTQCGVTVVSGEVDWIVGPEGTCGIANGHPMMPRVTGLGCSASALCGAFAAVNPDPFFAAAHAMAVMGIVGELAAEAAPGPGSLQLRLLDALYGLTRADVAQRLKVVNHAS
jgi:hydroxyethylthiazole kinase